jgi:hypothetical protein
MRRLGTDGQTSDELRAAHASYLIQKTSLAAPDVRVFLEGWLRTGSPSLQARALRAFGKLHDADVEQWLRPLCEQIAAGEADRIDPARMTTTQDDASMPVLHRAALETLRDVGDEASIDIVRRARSRNPGDHELRQLSFQVAEEMYWRLTGGLDSETYSSDPRGKD